MHFHVYVVAEKDYYLYISWIRIITTLELHFNFT